ncbi:hypothetical protein PRUPE_6G049800 [Prunus persica]|uniref:beta-carotene 3-hydroxylase n=1 Tax=Prunus persica TaxID=3760 RepID=M5W5U4_PRUPE|nr:hypothetical protein PRUPE_6G049800 [Prunus persica]
MAAGHFVATTPKPIRLIQSSYLLAKPNPTIFFPPSNLRHQKSAIHYRARRKLCFTMSAQEAADSQNPIVIPSVRVAEKLSRKKSERFTYLVAAGGNVPLSEMLGTFALSVGAAVGMEFWARWAHKALWHAYGICTRPREGPFELNDGLKQRKKR